MNKENDIYKALGPDLKEFNNSQKTPGAPSRGTQALEATSSKNVEKARAFIKNAKPAVAGEEGHNQLFRVACQLVQRFNLTEEKGRLLLQEYNKKCQPEWSESELQHKLEDALKAPFDLRKWTSPQNGQKGGRPAVITDIANAFAESKKDKDGQILIVHHRGSWFVYNGAAYMRVSENDIKNEIMSFLRRNFRDSASINMQKNVLAHLMSDDLAGLESQTETPVWLDTGKSAKDWIILKNKVINIYNILKLVRGDSSVTVNDCVRDHTPRLFSSILLPYDFDIHAKCPRFMKYLDRVLPDASDQEMLQMAFGLALVLNTSFNVFFVFWGPAGTGKSIAIYLLGRLVGEENVCVVPLSRFNDKFALGALTESLANIVGDLPTEEGHSFSLAKMEGTLKDVCSGGLLPVERKFHDPVSAPATARCFFASNSLPRFADRSDGIWDRMRIIPFREIIRGTAEENPHLRDELEEELPGIFNWAIAGLGKLLAQRNFPESPAGLRLKKEHRYSCDREKVFLEERIEEQQGGEMEAQLLYDSYKIYCNECGYQQKNIANFSQDIVRIFPDAERIRGLRQGTKKTIWKGIAWKL